MNSNDTNTTFQATEKSIVIDLRSSMQIELNPHEALRVGELLMQYAEKFLSQMDCDEYECTKPVYEFSMSKEEGVR